METVSLFYEMGTLFPDLRIVMLGKTGAGKSATGNTILGKTVFTEDLSSESVTKECQKHEETVDSRTITVIDTPGQFDTSFSNEELKDEIQKCVEMSVPGPHAFLLVTRLDVRFTEEEKNTVKWIQKNFSEQAMNYAVVLFTRGDQLKTSIEEYLQRNNQLKELVHQCKGGYHVFNNTEENPAQVTELIEKIDRMVKQNGEDHYTNEMYQEAQRKFKEEEERIREEEMRNMEAIQKRLKEDDQEKRNKKIKNVLLSVGTGAGATAVVAGGAVLVTTASVILPAAAVAAGAAVAIASGAALIAEKVKDRKWKWSKDSKYEKLL